MKRRRFLQGLLTFPALAAPTIAKANPTFQAGDHVNYSGPVPSPKSFTGGKIVSHIGVDGTVFCNGQGFGHRLDFSPYHPAELKLFEGLPGNRVDNPSMRHRLIATPGRIGLRYPEDPI